ncbi:MAG: 23S rRNA (adenine(2503)-C(2))-methyltransferase RlmN [Eubacteriales bacterium]|nr:23S rRNA (adenine(2503)-C(2))-methyltransferase RlmN [Eubacteriales bacterium]
MIDIMSYTEEECVAYAVAKGESGYRGKQLFGWFRKGITSFDEMKNIPRGLCDIIKNECLLAGCAAVKTQISSDGTRKYLFRLHDGEMIESVFMKYIHGNTVCVSTQAGCRMGCVFCASTINGLKRNLYPSEMLSQITEIQKDTGERVSNVVLMGMGEPLDNYENVIKFLRLLNCEKGLNIGYRHVSLSTCGLTDKMERLADEGLPVTLSVSLHAPNGNARKQLMPIANKYGYDELLKTCVEYEKKTKRRVSFEYALISGVNDRQTDAHELGKRLKGTLCHVNLIPLNQTERKVYKSSEKSHIETFTNILESYKITVTVRRSLGGDISAACGQLKAETADG